MKNDQEEAYEKVLTTTLARVIDFVKFAETKNAALLTFSSAWILASVTLLYGASGVKDPDWISVFYLALPLFTFAALLAIYSFLPKTNLDFFHKDPEREKSLLYFGDAASFAPASYKERMEKRYRPPEEHSATQNYLDDLSIQIAVNSQIAVCKFTLFNWGGRAVLLAIALLLYPPVKSFLRFVATHTS